MKRIMAVLLCVLVMCFTAGCGDEYELENELEKIDMDSLVELYNIQITAGDMILSGVLYDTPTARDFADMLPLTVELWHPAPDFARAFDLPERIPKYAKAGYEYELGSLAYWYEGPSIALIYKASRDQTVVPVVPIGKITSEVSVFEEYGGIVTIELVEALGEEYPDEEIGEE